MGAKVLAMSMSVCTVAKAVPAGAPIAKLSRQCAAPVLMLPVRESLDTEEFAHWTDVAEKAWAESGRCVEGCCVWVCV